MEFCDGDSLKSRLDDHDKPKILVTVLKDYAYQIASGMNYLARHGVLHNDLATRNILLTNNEQVCTSRHRIIIKN
jgi:serine/threonine protein kinase